jgi:hypothetical protein
VASYSDKISEFNKRIADIASKLSGLSDKRRSYSLAAASGDARALKQIGDVDFELDALRKEQQTINSAIETATALDKQHELEAHLAEDRARRVEAHKSASAVAAINSELDGMLVQLRECLERRAIHLRSLSNTGVVDPNLIMRLSNKSGPTSAAHLAGLGRHINLEMVPVVAQRPLADSNSLLLGIGTPPSGNGSNGKPLLRPVTKSRGAP